MFRRASQRWVFPYMHLITGERQEGKRKAKEMYIKSTLCFPFSSCFFLFFIFFYFAAVFTKASLVPSSETQGLRTRRDDAIFSGERYFRREILIQELKSSWNKLSPKMMASSRLVAPGSPRMAVFFVISIFFSLISFFLLELDHKHHNVVTTAFFSCWIPL